MNTHKSSKGFSLIDVLFILILLAILGSVGIYVYSKSQSGAIGTSLSSEAANKIQTDCFITEVPKQYTINLSAKSAPHNCVFSAYVGSSVKSSSSFIAILPSRTLIDSMQDAEALLRRQAPNAKKIKPAKVGGYDAVGTEGYKIIRDGEKEKYVATFIAYSPKQYAIKNGEYKANAFLVLLTLLPEDATKVHEILGLQWK